MTRALLKDGTAVDPSTWLVVSQFARVSCELGKHQAACASAQQERKLELDVRDDALASTARYPERTLKADQVRNTR